jgi:hypothetical protein
LPALSSDGDLWEWNGANDRPAQATWQRQVAMLDRLL